MDLFCFPQPYTHQDLLSRNVLGFAMRMFPPQRQYHPFVMSTDGRQKQFFELFATHFETNFRDEVDEWKRAGFATGIGSLIFPSLHYWSSYHILYRPGRSKLELFFFSHYDLISIEIQVSFLQNKFFGLILLAEFGSNGKWKELSVCWKITCSFRLSWKWVASVQRPKEYTLRPAIVASWPLYMVK